jgi:hypothetical protein
LEHLQLLPPEHLQLQPEVAEDAADPVDPGAALVEDPPDLRRLP